MSEHPAVELAALLSGAAALSRSGNRVAAIAALLSAVEVAPDDLTAHRRLAAAYGVAGDRESVRYEYDRFIARLETRGAIDAAQTERAYAAAMLAPRSIAPTALSATALSTPTAFAPARKGLTTDQALALRRVAVAIVAIAATVTAMLAAGAQILASGGPL